MVKKIQIEIAQSYIDDLKSRLKKTRWPDEIESSGWSHGSNLDYMKDLISYWINYFDWRKTEEEINRYGNYIARIDGYKIHFLHIKSAEKNKLPIILTHGWPYSFLEMMKLIPLLTENSEMAFDLVIPSLPGYGFSEKINQPGCNVSYIAEIWQKLMYELGYNKYGVHGNDFGAGVSTALTMKYPENVIGLHLNNIPANYVPKMEENEKFSEEEEKYLDLEEEWYSREGGFLLEQNTKPLTLSYGLNDSPVGLCAWIVEKMFSWSDCRGYIGNSFTMDEILSNVSLYWITKTIYSSVRLFGENSKAPLIIGKDNFIKIPVCISRFAFEELFPPRKFIERGYNIQRWSEFSEGGHFPAMEKPELLAEDIRSFFISPGPASCTA